MSAKSISQKAGKVSRTGLNRALIAVLFLIGLAVPGFATDVAPRCDLRISGGSFWNYGWGDKFFFHTGRIEDLYNDPEGEIRSWYRTLQHYTGPNL